MGIFDKFFNKEQEKKEKKVEEIQKQGIDPSAPLYENKLICNACGKEIDGKPRFFNLHGRKMIFHKGCFKKLQNGQIQL